jgi:bifunctional UDP-N-acetylglucosamine pyrophosphorylase/glucosamine-1-phosphate N-acetyltransferase
MPINVVILAAGQGKRMHSELPKVLHRLAGKPLLAHVIAAARTLKPRRICVVYGHGGELVPQTFAYDDLIFVRQKQQLGTGHAVKQVLSRLDPRGDTLVLYGDVPLITAATLAKLAAGRGERVKLLTATFDDPYGYGRILRDSRGGVSGIVEEKDATPAQRRICEGNTGLMLLPTKRLAGWLARLSNRNAQGEYYLTDIVGIALNDDVAIETVSPHALWEVQGVNSQRQLADLERVHQLENAHRLLDAGVNIADPRRFDLRGKLRCGKDVRIDINCVFEGEVSLGRGVEIGANCVIRDASIGAGTRVAPFSVIDQARVGLRCVIGPFARIRPATELADEVHVGNFVEVKASKIGSGSKANHLAYVGDSIVGRRVNVGAGTITCNYDGAHKHQTVIEDDVFIGSDTQLVAPVTVRRGATIGAGSTITEEAPAHQLTLSRARQISIPNWKRPRKAAKDK